LTFDSEIEIESHGHLLDELISGYRFSTDNLIQNESRFVYA